MLRAIFIKMGILNILKKIIITNLTKFVIIQIEFIGKEQYQVIKNVVKKLDRV